MLTAAHKTHNKVTKQTFSIPPAGIITGLREHQADIRNQSALGDAYVASYYRVINGEIRSSTRLFSGNFPPKTGKKGTPEHAEYIARRNGLYRRLFEFMDESAKDASFKINERDMTHNYFKNDHVCALFARCKNGFVGITWFQQSGDLESAYRMCAFHMNLLGRINENDRDFAKSSQILLSKDGKTYANSLFDMKTWDWRKEIRTVELD